MSHERPYKKAMPYDEVIAEIDHCAGRHFDPTIVEAFHRLDQDTLRHHGASSPTPLSAATAWRALGERGDPINHGSSTATDALLEAVFENTPTAALITDDQRQYVAANKAACEMLHLTLDELRLRRFGNFTPPESRADLDQGWIEFLRAGVQDAKHWCWQTAPSLRSPNAAWPTSCPDAISGSWSRSALKPPPRPDADAA